ncbi:BTB/POZ and MATH domain-containing protein 2 [Brachypodium distachyon]|uniref:BTB/POZ and MATH domain-containing protein 2 n=1 Tax=Brachypodium distachyon TaxID=15368 RepID=UPI00071D497C|nr:BTB/POZ and MATH domain-containing protein 2 [Brachypodium distachyon]|eukprot:XP_010236411.2 BTB/POZ and MATH domain-containing protein 2 [Brachypodium distachyon]
MAQPPPMVVPETTTGNNKALATWALPQLIKDLGVGKSVRSGDFSVGGYRWAVLFYPSGSEPPKQPGGARHVSAYLELLTPNVDEVRVMFDLSLTAGTHHPWVVAEDFSPADSAELRRRSFFKEGDFRRHASFSTTPPPLRPPRPLPPHHPPRCWGVAEFARGDLAPFIVDGGLVIRCDVTVIKPPRVTPTRRLLQAPTAMPPLGLGEDRRRLLEKEKRDTAGADVEVLVRGESVAAHRALLAARSPVLRKRLHETGNTAVAGDDDEKENDKDGDGKKRRHTAAKRVAVTVDDVEPAVFKAMLHFIYTDELPPESAGEATELLQWLFEAAKAYGVERLPQMCEAVLCARLSKATIKAAAAFARRHGGSCDKLKTACLEFYKATHRVSETAIIGSEQRLKRSLPDGEADDDDSEAAADKRLKRA